MLSSIPLREAGLVPRLGSFLLLLVGVSGVLSRATVTGVLPRHGIVSVPALRVPGENRASYRRDLVEGIRHIGTNPVVQWLLIIFSPLSDVAACKDYSLPPVLRWSWSCPSPPRLHLDALRSEQRKPAPLQINPK